MAGSSAVVDSKSKAYYVINRRNVRAVGAVWAIFVVCLAIVNVVVVAQPQWLGDTSGSPGVGFFGLIRHCRLYQSGSSLVCAGQLDDFSTLLSDAFKAATVFSGLAALLTLATIVLMILFFFVTRNEWVFRICGAVLAVTCLFSFLGCVIFPSGWDHATVRAVCGSTAGKFNPGTCSVRWAFVLAIISIFDSLVLSILAFVLAAQLERLRPLEEAGDAKPKSEVNSGFADDRAAVGYNNNNWAGHGDNFTDVSGPSVARSTKSRNFQL